MGFAFVAIGELAASSALALPVCSPERFLGPDNVSEAITRTRPDSPSRLRARDAFYPDLHAWRDGVEKTNLGDLFQIRHAAELYRALYPIFDEPGPRIGRGLDPELARTALDRLGVARIVTDRPALLEIGPVLASGSRQGRRFEVLGNPDAMPRAYVVPRAEVVPEGETIGRLSWVDPRAVVLLPRDPMAGVDGPRQPFTPARFDREGPDRVVVRVRTEAPGFLVVAETWMPGWSATIDGRSTPVLRGDHAFLAVAIPGAGSHRIELEYRAPGLATGAVISALAAGVVVALSLGCGGRRGSNGAGGESMRGAWRNGVRRRRSRAVSPRSS